MRFLTKRNLFFLAISGLTFTNSFAGRVEITTAELRISQNDWAYADSILQTHLLEKPNDPKGLFLMGKVQFGYYNSYNKKYEEAGKLGETLSKLDAEMKAPDVKPEVIQAKNTEKQTAILTAKLNDDTYWTNYWKFINSAVDYLNKAKNSKPDGGTKKEIANEEERVFAETQRMGYFFIKTAAQQTDEKIQQKFFGNAYENLKVANSINEELFSKSFGNLYNYAISAEQTNKESEAKIFYNKALKIAKKDEEKVKILGRLASFDLEEEKFQDAIKSYDELLKIDGKNIDAINNSAYCYEKIGDKKKSNEFKQKLLELDPEGSTGIIAEQGNTCLEQEDFDCAVEKFEKVLAKEPNNEAVINNIGYAYLKRGKEGDAQKAFANFEKYTQLKAEDCQGWMNLSIAAKGVEKTDIQINCLKKLQELKCK
ncbi:hypothetical protein IT568_05890 [bacterium]|nr:hypothetical protein [bacterium]